MKLIVIAFGFGWLVVIPVFSTSRIWFTLKRIKLGLSYSRFWISPIWFLIQIVFFYVPAFLVGSYLVKTGELEIAIYVLVAAICSGLYLGMQEY